MHIVWAPGCGKKENGQDMLLLTLPPHGRDGGMEEYLTPY